MEYSAPQIQRIDKKLLVGKHTRMSLTDDKTADLWHSFMPLRKTIVNRLNDDFLSLQVYPPTYFEKFIPASFFEKWALVEVTDFDNVPAGLETFILPSGLYAIFPHKGTGEDRSIFHYIYSDWLPASVYSLDDRPHFELLGEQYRNNDPDSEEEIWIPVTEG